MRVFVFWRMLVLALRLAVRQLRSEKYFSMAMIANMLLGLVGYLVVGGFNQSFVEEIGAKTRQIAGGDLVISARLPWNKRQLEIIDESLAGQVSSDEMSLVSMVSSRGKARLVDLRFVDVNYPLYPGLQMDARGQTAEGSGNELRMANVWIHRELQPQLGLALDDKIKIGEVWFTVAGIITDDPTASVGSFGFAPRVYVGLDFADDTKLIGLGSRVFYSKRFLLDDDINIKTIASSLKSKFTQEFPSQDIRVKTHFESSRETSRLYTYLNDYLSLIALISLFLAGLGFSYLIKSHLDSSIAEVAIMSALGAPRAVGFSVYLIQGLILGGAATGISVVAAGMIMPFLAQVMEPVAGSVLNLKVPIYSGVRGGFYCLLSGTLLSIPQLLRLWSLNTATLLVESAQGGQSKSKLNIAGTIPAVLLLWFISVSEARSFANGTVFASTVVGAAALLSLLAVPLSNLALRVSSAKFWGWKISLALKLLSRNRLATSSTFVALAIGAALLNVIPQIKTVISREISRPDSRLPQLFMFDVQDEQLDGVRSYFIEKGANADGFYPMVRARLEMINDENVSNRKMNLEGEREEQQREALQSRTQNLSYRVSLSSSEEIIAGNFISEQFSGQGLPALSVEERFAERVGVRIGDRMSFDVLGVPIEGEITSLRRVRWTSFEPNFMILVQPGVLDEAPKTWVGSVAKIPVKDMDSIIGDVIGLYSNITVIDVKSAVKRLLGLVDKVGAAVALVSWLALLGGCGVLFAIAYARSTAREYAIGILKVLGALPRDALFSILVEYAFVAIFAVGFGVILSFGLSWGIAKFVFNASWSGQDLMGVANGFVILPISLILAWLATRRSLKVKIMSLLN